LNTQRARPWLNGFLQGQAILAVRFAETYKSAGKLPLLGGKGWQRMSDADELARIRQRKLQALREQQRQQEAAKQAEAEQAKEREKLIQSIFLPDAVAYLNEMRQSKPELATQIEDIAIMLFSEQQLFEPIPKTGVQLVERRLGGVESRITVKRRGKEATSLYEVVRKDLTDKDKG